MEERFVRLPTAGMSWVALLTTAEAEGLSAVCRNVTMMPTSMASSVAFAVSGFVVAPSVGLAITVLLWRWWW